jgi:hypothetical protein
MENNGELDRMIDGALAAYSAAEPLAGLEERVLYRVQAAEAGRRRGLAWALVIAVAASVVIAAIVVRAPRHSEPKTYIVGVPAVTLPAPAAEKPRVAMNRLAKSRTLRSRALLKQEQFPAALPITAEERALVALAEHPKEAEDAFAELRKQSNGPIEIQAIQIPPLQNDGAQ